MNMNDLYFSLTESQKIEFLDYERENPATFNLIRKSQEHFNIFLISILKVTQEVICTNFEKEFNILSYNIWVEANYRPMEYN